MAYIRVNWINEQEGSSTPLNAENLNKMDKGIFNLDTDVEEIKSEVKNIQDEIGDVETLLSQI